ncbi:hypothetical protein EVAR_87652_1 [Eumeta japonica]|uniref:Uncharacterized protein n=1 Tax=Eumeta variegata TaxID=151549 RepID=A0A4C1WLS4_EUMVA|nr:hypothetical protein EVAR_87652_1 [Eumeta japonica]
MHNGNVTAQLLTCCRRSEFFGPLVRTGGRRAGRAGGGRQVRLTLILGALSVVDPRYLRPNVGAMSTECEDPACPALRRAHRAPPHCVCGSRRPRGPNEAAVKAV